MLILVGLFLLRLAWVITLLTFLWSTARSGCPFCFD